MKQLQILRQFKRKKVNRLSRQLEEMIQVDEVPEELEQAYLLAVKTLDSGKKAKNEWNDALSQVDEKFEAAEDSNNPYNALVALQLLENIPVNRIFNDNGYEFDEESKADIKNRNDEITHFIESIMEYYISNMYCDKVEKINTFRNHNTKVENLLSELGFVKFAELVRRRKESELGNIEEIRSRQELRADLGKEATVEEIKEAVTVNMQDWGRRFPHAGYGGSFRHWLRDKNPKPYGSYGNGSAMRVSAAGWLYDSLERTREVARATAEVTHNHPEGVKGAEATASCIFLARRGFSKDEIRSYVETKFHYDLDRTLDAIRPYYHHVESCQETVPEAIIAFMEAKNFEDTIRNAVSLGGDTDTLGAIAGSIAEAFYGIPDDLKNECRARCIFHSK